MSSTILYGNALSRSPVAHVILPRMIDKEAAGMRLSGAGACNFMRRVSWRKHPSGTLICWSQGEGKFLRTAYDYVAVGGRGETPWREPRAFYVGNRCRGCFGMLKARLKRGSSWQLLPAPILLALSGCRNFHKRCDVRVAAAAWHCVCVGTMSSVHRRRRAIGGEEWAESPDGSNCMGKKSGLTASHVTTRGGARISALVVTLRHAFAGWRDAFITAICHSSRAGACQITSRPGFRGLLSSAEAESHGGFNCGGAFSNPRSLGRTSAFCGSTRAYQIILKDFACERSARR